MKDSSVAYERADSEPSTLDQIHRHIRESVGLIKQKIDEFTRNQLKDPKTSFVDWDKTVKTLCKRLNISNESIRTLNDFEVLFHFVVNPSEDKNLYHYGDMNVIYTRHVEFEGLWHVVSNYYIKTIRKMLQRYCISFQEETATTVTPVTVEAYQRDIEQLKPLVDDSVLQLEHTIQKYRTTYVTNIRSYFRDYYEVVQLMSELCHDVVKSTAPALEWLELDVGYVPMLEDEYYHNIRALADIREKLVSVDGAKVKAKERLQQAETHVISLQREKERLKEELVSYRRRTSGFISSHSQGSVTADRLKARLAEIEQTKNKTTWLMNPKLHKDLGDESKAIKVQLEEVERKMMETKKRMDAMKTAEDDIYKDMGENDKNLEHEVAKYERATNEREKLELNIRQLQKTSKTLESTNSILKRIIFVKKASFTYKRIYRQGYQPGTFVDKDELQQAIQIVKNHIGHHWQDLYNALPFVPDRSTKERTRDIDGIVARSNHDSARHRNACQKSLEKWRRRHTNPTVQDLIGTLRSLQLTDLAKQVEQHFSQDVSLNTTQNVYKAVHAINRSTQSSLRSPDTHVISSLAGRYSKERRNGNDRTTDSSSISNSTFSRTTKRAAPATPDLSRHYVVRVIPASSKTKRHNKFEVQNLENKRERNKKGGLYTSEDREKSIMELATQRTRNSVLNHIKRTHQSRSSFDPSSVKIKSAKGSGKHRTMSDVTLLAKSRSIFRDGAESRNTHSSSRSQSTGRPESDGNGKRYRSVSRGQGELVALGKETSKSERRSRARSRSNGTPNQSLIQTNGMVSGQRANSYERQTKTVF